MAAGWGRMLLVVKKALLLVSPIWKGLDPERSLFVRPPCGRCPTTGKMGPPSKETSATVIHPDQGDRGELPVTSMDTYEEPVSLKTQGKDSPDELEESVRPVGEVTVNENGYSSPTPPPVSVNPTAYSVNTHEESQGKDSLERFEENSQLIVTDRFPPQPEVVPFTSTVTPVDDASGENLTEIPSTGYVTEGPAEQDYYDLSQENTVIYEDVQSEVFTDEDVDGLDEVVETTTPGLDMIDSFEHSTTTESPNEYVTDRVLDYDLDSFTTVVPLLDDITTVLDASYDAVSGVMNSGTVLLSPTLYSQKIHFEYGGDASSLEANVHIRPNRIYISGSGITSSTDALFDVGDSRITTFPSTLDIDSSGSFDPSLISKATNFQATHYSTTTRSATVTTTISRENLVELSLEHISSGLYCNCNTSNGTSDPVSRSMKSNCSCNITEANVQVSGQVGEKQMELHTESTEEYDIAITESFADGRAVEVDFITSAAGTPVYEHETTETLSIIQGKTTGVDVPKVNVTTEESFSQLFVKASSVSNDFGMDSHSNKSYIFDNENGTFAKNADKKPLTIHTSGISNIESSTNVDAVNFPLGVTVIIVFSALLLAVMILGMLLLRRRFKNHSKVYLSFEAKPRAMFTRPMRPALLPTEIGQVNLHPHDVPRPRAPILLLEENQCSSGGQTSDPSPNPDGVDNVAFVEIPLEELNTGTPVAKDVVKVCDPPKYRPDIQLENDTDSGIRVWSSTGSLHSLSPSLSRCSRPPPPYTPEGTYASTQNYGSRHIGNIKLSWPDDFLFKKDRPSSTKHEFQSENVNKNQGKGLPYYSDTWVKSMEPETSHNPVPVHDWSSLSEKLEKVTVSD